MVACCCICYEEGKRYKRLIARHMRTENGKTEYQGLVLGLDLCEQCVKDYHKPAKHGILPITLDEDRDMKLSEYLWTHEFNKSSGGGE